MPPVQAPSPSLLRYLRSSLSPCVRARHVATSRTPLSNSTGCSKPQHISRKYSSTPSASSRQRTKPQDQQKKQQDGPSNSSSSSSPPRQPRFFRPSGLVLPLTTLLTLYPALDFLTSHFLQIMTVTGPSMSPLLNTEYDAFPHYENSGSSNDGEDGGWLGGKRGGSPGPDRVLVSMYKPYANLRRGTVVAFWSPAHPEKMVVKRVVALEGDVVFARQSSRADRDQGRRPGSHRLSQSPSSSSTPRPLDNERRTNRLDTESDPPAQTHPQMEMEIDLTGPSTGIVIPQGHIWVEGEHPDGSRRSYDSNTYGPVSRSLVVGKVLGVAWPWRKRGWIRPDDWTIPGDRVIPGGGWRRMERVEMYSR